MNVYEVLTWIDQKKEWECQQALSKIPTTSWFFPIPRRLTMKIHRQDSICGDSQDKKKKCQKKKTHSQRVNQRGENPPDDDYFNHFSWIKQIFTFIDFFI